MTLELLSDRERMISIVSNKVNISVYQIAVTIKLLEAENTIPFIARYRKDVTGNLDENQLRSIQHEWDYIKTLVELKKHVFTTITEQEKMTPIIEDQLIRAQTITEVEDIYAPFKRKKKTKADIAKENGLEPLAEKIMALDATPLEDLTKIFLSEKVPDQFSALQGAVEIIADTIGHNMDIKNEVREIIRTSGFIQTKIKNETLQTSEKALVYKDYFDFKEPLNKIAPHRVLAINRAEKDNIITVTTETEIRDKTVEDIQKKYLPENVSKESLPPTGTYFLRGIEYAYSRFLAPSAKTEIWNEVKETAFKHSIEIFVKNLESLLLIPPIKGHTILGLDPGYRTGCKLAVVNSQGKLMLVDTVYLHTENRSEAEKKRLDELIEKTTPTLIAIGDGTASRETEEIIVQLPMRQKLNIPYLIVSEAGASVYSASPLAAEEFPELDVSLRGTISICRRVQDPLAELVKIDPKSIGVGEYQHDVPQKDLEQSLTEVVESVVNRIGVDINQSSPSLLSYISGISKSQAKAIYEAAMAKKFINRMEILDIKGIGSKTFEQSAGFLRITDNPQNPLDSTGIHPESYLIAESILDYLKFPLNNLLISSQRTQLKNQLERLTIQDLKHVLSLKDVGDFTLNDILSALKAPFRDPRADLDPPILRTNLIDMDSLSEGMELTGTVKNVTSFGVFVDIGIKVSGLVHISEISNQFITDPFQIVRPGDRIQVKIISLDKTRNRIGLSMKQVGKTEEDTSREGYSKKKNRTILRDVVKESSVPTTGKFSLDDLKRDMMLKERKPKPDSHKRK